MKTIQRIRLAENQPWTSHQSIVVDNKSYIVATGIQNEEISQAISAVPDLIQACQFALDWINEIKAAHPNLVPPKGWGTIELEYALNKALGKK